MCYFHFFRKKCITFVVNMCIPTVKGHYPAEYCLPIDILQENGRELMLQKKTAEQRRGQLQRCASCLRPRRSKANASKNWVLPSSCLLMPPLKYSVSLQVISSYIEDCQRTLSHSTLQAQCSQTSSSWEPLVKHWDAASGQKGARGEIMRQSST